VQGEKRLWTWISTESREETAPGRSIYLFFFNIDRYSIQRDRDRRKYVFGTSVAEPELEPEPERVEQQLFAGAGAKVFYPAPAPEPGIKIIILSYKNPKFFILKFEVDLKNHNFVAIYFYLLMIIYFFLKNEHFFKTMKIVFFLNYMGKIVRAGAGARDGDGQKWAGSATLVNTQINFRQNGICKIF
jgi:hypothetical protein